MDYHTHNPEATDAIISLPREIVFGEQLFRPREGALYSAGIHPWWAEEADEAAFACLENLLEHEQVVVLGECGFDALKEGGGGKEQSLLLQTKVFERQILLSEKHRLPVTIHCVRAFHLLLAAKKRLNPTTQWTVHGFRGNAALARQLLDAGMDLSFGKYYNREAFELTPPERRRQESDEDF